MQSQNTIKLIQNHGEKLKLITRCLNSITKHGNMSYRLGLKKNLNISEVEKLYADWLYLVERFKDPVEKEFFNENWLNAGNIYMDLSKKEIPFFYADFLMDEKGTWIIRTIGDDIQSFADELNNNEINIDMYFNQLNTEYEKKVEEFYSEKYQWDIDLNEPITDEDIRDVMFPD
ncbi:hypothetical protein [Psychroflexus planctonicus]|uniref:DUF4240 domain-containing protein n=1 Tax=Psychroflexus planctonicus TaxID=1526575 RepID=A0ABQ1SF87_9FLAO|nr:hypothetical protein [Psychroflexus planctonicus]GGE27343.1 hypothetical protein GCM10010832_05060 [Psychroflexus planctonicus]